MYFVSHCRAGQYSSNLKKFLFRINLCQQELRISRNVNELRRIGHATAGWFVSGYSRQRQNNVSATGDLVSRM